MPEFTSGPWKLEWEDIGEGLSGDYNEEDPTDISLWRATLHYLVDGEYQVCEDGSYCTATPVNTPTRALVKLSEILFQRLPGTLPEEALQGPNGPAFPDRIMQEWTWDTDLGQVPGSFGSGFSL